MRRSVLLAILLLGLVVCLAGCDKHNQDRNLLTDGKEKTQAPVNTNMDEGKLANAQIPVSEKHGRENNVTTAKNEKIKVIVTKDFGKEKLLEAKVNFKKNMSVMDALLLAGADVKTSYGGGFVSGINGLLTDTGGVSGVRKDWFYYVNGIFADVGALDYEPKPGEIIWWDYHPWKLSQGIPAVVGCFPEPFLHGFRGQVKKTTIMCGSGETELAIKLKESMKDYGILRVDVQEINAEMLTQREGPTILIGEWEKLKDIAWMKELNNAYKKNGTFIHFTESSIELLDYQGEGVKKLQGSAGVIVATGEGSGDDSPLWLISGTDRRGFEEAVDVLAKCPQKIMGMYSAVVLPGEIIRLPLLRD